MAQQKLKNQSYNVDEFVQRALKNIYGNGGNGAAQQNQQQKKQQYSDVEKRLFWIGVGSTMSRQQYREVEERLFWMGVGSIMSRTEAGIKKHVVAMMGGDKSLIRSYENGRKKGTEFKQKDLQTQRTVRQAAKGKGAK